MKAGKRIIALLMVCAILLTLCACGSKGKFSGSYTSRIEGVLFTTLEFGEGNHVTSIQRSSGKRREGTYTFEGNTLKISYSDGKHDEFTYDKETDTFHFGDIVTFTKD